MVAVRPIDASGQINRPWLSSAGAVVAVVRTGVVAVDLAGVVCTGVVWTGAVLAGGVVTVVFAGVVLVGVVLAGVVWAAVEASVDVRVGIAGPVDFTAALEAGALDGPDPLELVAATELIALVALVALLGVIDVLGAVELGVPAGEVDGLARTPVKGGAVDDEDVPAAPVDPLGDPVARPATRKTRPTRITTATTMSSTRRSQ